MKKFSSFSTSASGSLRIRPAAIPVLVIGVLSFLGFALPANAGTLGPFRLTKASPSLNKDVCSGAGTWTFSYTQTGKVSFLQLAVKNNPSAGDWCWVTSFRQPAAGTYPLNTSPIPAAQLNACGPQFTDNNGIPLDLSLTFTPADPKATVDVTVVYPDRSASDEATYGACLLP